MKTIKLNQNQVKILRQLYKDGTNYHLSGQKLRTRAVTKPLVFLPNIRALIKNGFVINEKCTYMITEKGIAALKKEIAEGELQKLGVFK